MAFYETPICVSCTPEESKSLHRKQLGQWRSKWRCGLVGLQKYGNIWFSINQTVIFLPYVYFLCNLANQYVKKLQLPVTRL